jgi:hypothetical protein
MQTAARRSSSEKRVQGGGGTLASGRQALGAELSLKARQLLVDGTFSLPSGRLTLQALDDLRLGDAARLDLAGRTLTLNDVTQYSWGGELVLGSQFGDIHQAAGALIDLSARGNRAGRLTAIALGEQGGRIELLGQHRLEVVAQPLALGATPMARSS